MILDLGFLNKILNSNFMDKKNNKENISQKIINLNLLI